MKEGAVARKKDDEDKAAGGKKEGDEKVEELGTSLKKWKEEWKEEMEKVRKEAEIKM